MTVQEIGILQKIINFSTENKNLSFSTCKMKHSIKSNYRGLPKLKIILNFSIDIRTKSHEFQCGLSKKKKSNFLLSISIHFKDTNDAVREITRNNKNGVRDLSRTTFFKPKKASNSKVYVLIAISFK